MTLYGTTSVHTILHDTIPSYINIIHHGSAFCNSLDNSTTKICAGARKKLRMNEPVIGLNAERYCQKALASTWIGVEGPYVKKSGAAATTSRKYDFCPAASPSRSAISSRRRWNRQ